MLHKKPQDEGLPAGGPDAPADLAVAVARDLTDILVAILGLTKSLFEMSAAAPDHGRTELIQRSEERADDLARVLRMLAVNGAPPKPAGERGEDWLFLLSLRERDILRGVTRGMSNKEIARQLDLAEVTIKTLLGGIFRKLGTRSRVAAAVKAAKAGFGDGPPG